MNISSMDMMQWAMGWSWPVVAVLAVLMAWGIARVLSWPEQDVAEEGASGPASDENRSCTCG
ncbi:MAG: hypothetical protein ACYC7L_06965 [Nitrospirota bacterium]